MTIPFLDLFKRAKARLGKQPEAPRMLVPRSPLPEKLAGERLSKTVMPNTTRTVAPVDPFQAAAGAAGGSIGRSREFPTPLTPPEKIGDRSISLSISDLLEHLPAASIKPQDSFNANRIVTIKAVEVEKGMATGQPTALLASIYEQAPEIFRQSVGADDLTQVPLPFEKVLQQFQTLQVRGDQMQDEAVPQVETPFLQVTLEDTKKFGTSLAPLQTSAKPPVKVEPATARSLAKAEPEPVAQQKQTFSAASRRPISLTPKTDPRPATGAESPAGPTRIPFRLPPNGTGAPASERVPASSGPPVLTPPPAPPKSATPARIPFKLTPTHADLKPKLTLVPGVDPAKTEASPAPPSPPAQPAEAAKSEAAVVRLRLNVCLRNLPAFQLSGELPEISDDILIELPYSVIEPQLASGRIAIDAKVFHGAMPEKFRNLFVVDATETPVLLPLQEVLQHLPTTALKMRHDQEQEEAIEHFETPFSLHAKEDRKRFGEPTSDAGKMPEPETPDPSVAAPTEAPQAEAAPVEKAEEKAPAPAAEPEKPAAVEAEKKTVGTEAESKAGSADHQPASTPPATTENQPATSAENTVAAAEAKSNAKEFVLRVSCLPGVAGCSIAFADGLTMAGNLPPGLGADGLCAVAPSVLQKLEKHMLETDLGPLNAMTLHCTKSPLSFFMQGNVCLTVLHAERTLEPVTQEQLVEMTKELAQIFAQPETTHVDH